VAQRRLKRSQRRELIRQLILGGATDAEIGEQFAQGFTIREGPHTGKHVKATAPTIRGDLAAIADEYRELVTDATSVVRLEGSAVERLHQTAGAALLAQNYAGATRASVELIRAARDAARYDTADEDLDRRIDHALGRKYAPRRRPGRPSKLNRAIVAQVADDLRLGMTRQAAAARAGVGAPTLYAWLAQGRDHQAAGRRSVFRELADAVERADADCQASALATINQAIRDGSWQAAFRLLECRHPDEYARRPAVAVQQNTVVQADGPAIVTGVPIAELADLSPDQLRAIAYDPDTDTDTQEGGHHDPDRTRADE